MNGMPRLIALLLLLLTPAAGVSSAHGQTVSAQGQAIDLPKPKETVSPETALSNARRLSQLGKFDEAIAQLKALAANQPQLKGLAQELGVVYYKKGEYLKAVASFKKALEEDPGDNEAVQLMGLSYYLAGRPAEAIAPLEKVQTGFPSANGGARDILGGCYMQTKDYPKARRDVANTFGVRG